MTKLGRIILLAIIAFLPLYYLRFSIFGVPTNVVEILVLIGFVAALFSDQKSRRLDKQIVIGILLMIIGAAVGTLVADHKSVALGILKGWFVIPVLFYWSCWRLFDQKSVHWLFWAAIFSALSVSLYTLLQWSGYLPLVAHQNKGGNLSQYLEQGRALAFFESPNYVPMYLVPLLAIGASYIWIQSRSLILLLAFVLPVAAAVYLSGSRAGLMALLTVSLITLLWRRSVKATLATLAVLVAAVAIFSLGAPKTNTSDQARLFIWRHAAELLTAKPLTGIGPGQFQAALDKKLALDSYYQNNVRAYALHPHNLFLSMWLSAGVLGLIGLLLLLFRIFFVAAFEPRLSQIRVGVLAAVAAVLVHGLFDTTYFKNDLSIIFFLALALWQIGQAKIKGYDST